MSSGNITLFVKPERVGQDRGARTVPVPVRHAYEMTDAATATGDVWTTTRSETMKWILHSVAVERFFGMKLLDRLSHQEGEAMSREPLSTCLTKMKSWPQSGGETRRLPACKQR